MGYRSQAKCAAHAARPDHPAEHLRPLFRGLDPLGPAEPAAPTHDDLCILQPYALRLLLPPLDDACPHVALADARRLLHHLRLTRIVPLRRLLGLRSNRCDLRRAVACLPRSGTSSVARALR